MKDHTYTLDRGEKITVAEMTLTQIHLALARLERPGVKYKGKATKESARERLLIELIAREIKA